jgi:hypothetical protein
MIYTLLVLRVLPTRRMRTILFRQFGEARDHAHYLLTGSDRSKCEAARWCKEQQY